MWIIIGVAIPVVLAIYGLARLQQNRNSHGAQGPAGSANSRRADSYIPARLYKADSYNHDDLNQPSTTFPATTLQSAEEKEAAARKYLVKWDNDEGSEQRIDSPPHADTTVPVDVEEKKQLDKHKGNQADVKWDKFEEE